MHQISGDLEVMKENGTQISSKSRFNLVIVISHPIQYQTPFYKRLADQKDVSLKVLFCSDWGLKQFYDKDFKKEIIWDIPMLEGYRHEFLPNISLRPDPSNFWGLINPEVIKYLKKEYCDAVWIHGWNSFTNWIVMITCFLRGVPVLFRGESNLLQKSFFLKENLKRLVLKYLFKNIRGFLSIGTLNTEFYKSYGVSEKKIFLVPYTIDNDYFISKSKELELMKEGLKVKFGIPKDFPVILFSGKISGVKDPMTLLKAFIEVRKDIKSALVFVGDGVLKNRLEDYVCNNSVKNVYFLGFKNQSELPEFYSMADILVLPSVHEPWGLVVNEAMCFGLPVIVSDKVGASRDLVKDGVNGYIFKNKDVDMLSNYIKMLLLNEEDRKKMGNKSLEIITNWSYDACINGVKNSLRIIKR